MHPDEHNARVSLLSWATCAYTIVTTEQRLRAETKAVFCSEAFGAAGGGGGGGGGKHSDAIGALVRHGAVCPRVLDAAAIRQHCINLLSGK